MQALLPERMRRQQLAVPAPHAQAAVAGLALAGGVGAQIEQAVAESQVYWARPEGLRWAAGGHDVGEVGEGRWQQSGVQSPSPEHVQLGQATPLPAHAPADRASGGAAGRNSQ